MRRQLSQVHLVLVITFGLYLAYTNLAAATPLRDYIMIYMCLGELILVLPTLIYILLKKQKVSDYLRIIPAGTDNLKLSAVVLLCAYPVVVVINMISMIFVENPVEGVMPQVLEWGLLPALFAMAFLPAVAEEILCRGLLYGSYRECSVWRGALVSALVFALMHLNLNQFSYTLFLGIIFALVREATGSLTASMFMHFLMNGFNVALNYFVSIRFPEMAGEQQEAVPYAQYLTESGQTTSALTGAILLGLLFLVLTFVVIYRTFHLNEKSFKAVLFSGKGGRLADVWLLLFLAFAIWLTARNTIFL